MFVGLSTEELTKEETEILCDDLETESKRWWKIEALRSQYQLLPWRPNIGMCHLLQLQKVLRVFEIFGILLL